MITTGRCACGGVSYRLNGPLRPAIACHCEQCRRTSGHFVAATAVHRHNFELTESQTLNWFKAVPGFQRGFCNRCGSSLFFEEVGGDRISVASGTLDDSSKVQMGAHIYVHEKGDYYELEDSVPQFETADHGIAIPG